MWKIVYKEDCVIEVLARSSKNGAYGQNTLYSFSSSATNFHAHSIALALETFV